MKKRRLAVVCLAVCFLISFMMGSENGLESVEAETIDTSHWLITEDGFHLKENGPGTLEISAYTGKDTIPTIPTKYVERTVSSVEGEISRKEWPITGIGKDVFKGRSDLVGVVIPLGIEYIGNNAFEDCDGLTRMLISDGVESIGNYAFAGCDTLTKVVISKTVKSIGYDAFADCAALTEIQLSEGLETIGEFAFNGCGQLTNIIIPKSVTSIGGGAFANCNSLTSITIPEKVAYIGKNPFSAGDIGKSHLTEVAVDENNPYFSSEDGVLYDKEKTTLIACPAGKTELVIPDGVTRIGSYAFLGSGITNLILPESVTSIEEFVFWTCNITSIEIPASVTNIEEGAIAGKIRTIYGEAGSQAEKYAVEHGITFVAGRMPQEGAKPGESASPSETPTPGGSANPSETQKPAPAPSNDLPGDINQDSEVDLEDAQTALKAALAILQLDGRQKKIADVNQDGKVDLQDARLILQAALHIIELDEL